VPDPGFLMIGAAAVVLVIAVIRAGTRGRKAEKRLGAQPNDGRTPHRPGGSQTPYERSRGPHALGRAIAGRSAP
jgi:hypothetical protein